MDIVVINGRVAENIKTKKSSLLSPVIVFISAIIYGLSSFYIAIAAGRAEESYLIVYLFFAYFFIVASQLGVALLLWAMCKIFRGTSRFMQVFIAVGYTFLPYAVMASIHSYYFFLREAGQAINPVLAPAFLAAFACFICLLTRVLHLLEGFTWRRALISIAVGFIFFASFVYIFGY